MANYNIQLGVKIDSNAQKSIKEQLKNIEPEITNVKLSNNAIKSIQDQLKGANLGITIDTASIKQAQTEVNKLTSSLKDVSNIKTTTNTKLNGNSNLFNQVDFEAQKKIALNNAEAYWKKNNSIAKEYSEEYKRIITQMNSSINNDELKSANKQMAALKSSINLSNTNSSLDQSKFLANQEASLARVQKYINENTKAAKQYGKALSEAQSQIKGTTNNKELQVANAQFNALTKQISAAGQSGKSFGDQIKSAFSGLSQIFSVSSVILTGVSQVKEGFNELVQLDDAMVELKKVTDETSDSYKNFYYQANDIAKDLGATTQEVISQTAAWAQLGYAMQDAINLAKDSSILSTISPEMDIDTATETLISTMKAYKIDVKNVRDEISSKINEIGNNFAIDNNGISEILKRSSAAMAAANNTLDENIALGVAGRLIARICRNTYIVYI